MSDDLFFASEDCASQDDVEEVIASSDYYAQLELIQTGIKQIVYGDRQMEETKFELAKFLLQLLDNN